MIQKQELIQLIEGYSENDTNKALTLLFLTKYDDFWSKKNTVGQITCACWVINKEHTKALMTHHLKLNRWLQLGGHLEREDNTIVDSCIRELKEESGLNQFNLVSNDIFDMDVHKIPTSKKGVIEHFHFDIRMLFEADENESIQFDKSESNNLMWMAFEDILKLENASINRMVEKTQK